MIIKIQDVPEKEKTECTCVNHPQAYSHKKIVLPDFLGGIEFYLCIACCLAFSVDLVIGVSEKTVYPVYLQ